MFNFDIKKTSVYRSFRISSFPLLKYSGILSQICIVLFIVSLSLIIFSFLGFIATLTTIKILIFFLALSLLLAELYLFTEFKIKKLKIAVSISGAITDLEKYNLAEFLSIESCGIIDAAMKMAKKRTLEFSSEILFYAALLQSKEIQILIFRLGLDIEKLKTDLKNYLEKSQPQNGQEWFLDSFQKTMIEAMGVAHEMNHKTISEKELLVSLAKNDSFFKNVLVEAELKEIDIKNICLWLDALEDRIEKSKQFWTKENLSAFGSLGRDLASGFTVTLDQYSIDWRDVVLKNVFNEIIGHKKEADELEVILTKSKLSNALLIGEEGIGKKSIVQALAERCYLGSGSPELKDKRVVELDMVALISRIQDQEHFETTLDQIFQEVLMAGNVILVIDRLDNFVTQKTQKPGEIDISVILSKYLVLPNFKFIGITSFDGLHLKLEQVPSFLEYFRKIEVSEVSELETIRILQNISLALEQKYKILITYPSIREIINLTTRYLPNLHFPQKAIDILDEAATYIVSQKERIVEPHHIAKIISDKTQIPVGKLEFQEKSVLMNLEQLIHQKIVNQQDAVTEISIAMRRARSGIASKKRPMGVFLFLGPTGVGKTETAKALAEIYFGGVEKMIRLDMSEFQAISDIPRLIGAINPVEEQGLLTMPVRENPFSLVLLDEIEKAHPNILNLFLQVFDEGHITDGHGRKIMFTNTIIIATSNAGAPMIFKAVASGETLERDTLLDSLFEKGIFKPEFINRYDATVIFHPLTKENLMDIAQLMFSSLQKNLKEKDIDLIITDSLKEKIVELSYKPEFGAREMRRVMQDKIENEIAQALLSDKITKGDKVEINPDNFKIVVIK